MACAEVECALKTACAYKVAVHFSSAKKKKVGSQVATVYQLLGVLAISFILNLIPFAGPSNLLIASNAALMVDADPYTLGFLVALGAASAKFVHYVVAFFMSAFLSENRRKSLDATKRRIRKWAFFTLFVAAATPIPDEPIVVPLGLMKYNPLKFFAAIFLGKILITVIGAYLGIVGAGFLSSVMSEEILFILSIILTLVVTVVLLKIDVGKVAGKILNRVRKREQRPMNTKQDDVQ
jgi:membrane protein DedA with SNARE-associated domain